MEMMEMLTGTSVIRMGIYRDHGAMQIPGTRGKHAITPDTLWCSSYRPAPNCIGPPGSFYVILSLSWMWDVEIDWGNLGLCLVQARQPSPLGHDWPQPPWAGIFLAHDQRRAYEGSSHLLSELIIARPSAHWPHIDSKSDNNIDNQGWITYLVGLMLVFHLSKKLILTQCSCFWEMCLPGILWPWTHFFSWSCIHSSLTQSAADSHWRDFRGTWPDWKWQIIS